MSSKMGNIRTLVFVIIAVISISVTLDIFIEITSFNEAIKSVLNWGVAIAGFTVLLAAIQLGLYHLKHILKRSPGQWYFSIYTILIVIITFFMGVLTAYSPTVDIAYTSLLKEIMTPLSQATYGIVGFFFTASIFRSFRGRNLYVILFLISGCFVIFANVPIFGVIHPILQSTGVWIRGIPGVAGTRGIIIATSVGIIASGIRIIFGYERGFLGKEESGEG